MYGIVLRKNFASPKKLSLMHLFIYPWVNLCKQQPKLMYLTNITSLEVDNDRRWPLIACYSYHICETDVFVNNPIMYRCIY